MSGKIAWMTAPGYLASMSHVLGGIVYVFVLSVFFGVHSMFWLAPVGIALAAIKEFVVDARWETPKQTAKDNWTDFAFYLLGAAIGGGLLEIAWMFRRVIF